VPLDPQEGPRLLGKRNLGGKSGGGKKVWELTILKEQKRLKQGSKKRGKEENSKTGIFGGASVGLLDGEGNLEKKKVYRGC